MDGEVKLSMSGIEKAFYGVKVLHGINLDLRRGEVLGLVGENGAGKSTMMNVLGGVYLKDQGLITIDGAVYEPISPRSAKHAGIAFIHQELNLFSNLTVAENMFIDEYPIGFAGRIKKKRIRAMAAEYIRKYELPVSPETRVESLSMGTRQMIEIAKALMQNAKVIIFDEPTTSLSHREKEKLFKTILDLREQDISIIYISHILEDVFLLCDRISVLRDGRIIGTDKKEALSEAAVIKMMVGRELNQVYPSYRERVPGEVVLEALAVAREPMVRNMSLRLRKGEIVGLYGLMGAGRTEFVSMLFGVDLPERGEIRLKGELLSGANPAYCIRRGMAFITEDRRLEGLLMPKSVKDNLSLVKLPDLCGRFGVVDLKGETGCAEDAVAKLKIKVADVGSQSVFSLSGGNQQKVVFGKWVLKGPDIFVMDEPTRGVDVGAKFEIYSIISRMADDGAAVLVVSSEMEELMGICDRILVMRKGELAGEVPRSAFKQETIVNLAL